MHMKEMVLTFETERMFVRQLSLDDLPKLTAMLSDPDVMKHSVRGVCDETATRKFIEWCLSCYSSHGIGPWAFIDKNSSELIGVCGIGPERVAGVKEINLGYRLARRYWGKGYASESARAVLSHAFTDLSFESVVVIIDPEHTASLRVAEKAGFNQFEVIEFHKKVVRLYRLTREQWKTLHNKAMHATRA